MSDIKTRLKEFNWPVGSFIIGYHVALLVGLPFYFYYNTPGTALIVVSVALLFLTEIGIGAAYHRFYAHRCYKLSKPAEIVLLSLATLALVHFNRPALYTEQRRCDPISLHEHDLHNNRQRQSCISQRAPTRLADARTRALSP